MTDQATPAGGGARRLRAKKIKISTASLAGCFGCHTSLLDIDERLLELCERVEFDRSPLTDIKRCGPCDIGLIEGGVCNADNVAVLREFRARCKILVAVGACAVTGGLPALRNHLDLEQVLLEVYRTGPSLDGADAMIPNDPELPLPLDKVYPIREVVQVDYSLQGCPPPAEALWLLLDALIDGREPDLPYLLRHFD
jgi:NAD-reducing hydrogenase small subunit